jgi:hypothetical protein
VERGNVGSPKRRNSEISHRSKQQMANTYTVNRIDARIVYDGEIFGRQSQCTIVDEIFAGFMRLAKGGSFGVDLMASLRKGQD